MPVRTRTQKRRVPAFIHPLFLLYGKMESLRIVLRTVVNIFTIYAAAGFSGYSADGANGGAPGRTGFAHGHLPVR